MKMAAIIAIAAFAAGSVFSPPVQEAIAAVIATDVQCTGCVGSADIASSAVTTTKLASNSVNGGKISDGTISAADLGPDSVGASELKGVSKMLYAKCSFTPAGNVTGGAFLTGIGCSVPGAAAGDLAVGTVQYATPNGGNNCIEVTRVGGFSTNTIAYDLHNDCDGAAKTGTIVTSVIVFKQ